VSDARPVLALAADEAYALPLSVVVESALDHLDPNAHLDLFVLDGGLRADTRRRLDAAWTARGARVEWMQPGGLSLDDVKLGGHISVVTYFRILLPHVLPERVTRAIYLDCDVLVLGDLAQLWAVPLDGQPAAAVQDAAAPYLDTAVAFPELAARSAHILATRPVENYRELGLAPDLPYCNAGTLLMDVAAWRDEGIPQRILDCLTEQRRFVRFWDQYGINVVLAGRLAPLEPRWNVSCYLAEGWEHTPFHAEAHAECLSNPGAVHFLGPDKPWQLGSRLRWADAYRAALARTPWTPAERLRLQASARWGRERRRVRKHIGRLRKRLGRLR
jgi:lipopolysaccharide biosynthesis glycosyltransferase